MKNFKKLLNWKKSSEILWKNLSKDKFSAEECFQKENCDVVIRKFARLSERKKVHRCINVLTGYFFLQTNPLCIYILNAVKELSTSFLLEVE